MQFLCLLRDSNREDVKNSTIHNNKENKLPKETTGKTLEETFLRRYAMATKLLRIGSAPVIITENKSKNKDIACHTLRTAPINNSNQKNPKPKHRQTTCVGEDLEALEPRAGVGESVKWPICRGTRRRVSSKGGNRLTT